jgi:hypothetical protein
MIDPGGHYSMHGYERKHGGAQCCSIGRHADQLFNFLQPRLVFRISLVMAAVVCGSFVLVNVLEVRCCNVHYTKQGMLFKTSASVSRMSRISKQHLVVCIS